MATGCCTHREELVGHLPKELLQIRIEPEIGHRVLTNRIKPFLENYKQNGKYSSRDKEICEELLKALEVSDKFNAATKSASANANGGPTAVPQTNGSAASIVKDAIGQETTSLTDFGAQSRYMTSYQASYKPVEGHKLVDLTRPLTPKRPLSSYPYGASYNIGDPVGTSTYDLEFNRIASHTDRGHHDRNHDRIRYGATGENRNNPHPLESFLVWRFAREHSQPEQVAKSQSFPISVGRYFPSNEDATRLYEPLRTSIYRYDYEKAAKAAMAIRLAQSSGKKINFDQLGNSPKPAGPPYTLNTTHRSSYQRFTQVDEVLRPTTTRYGSNKKKLSINAGITPNVSEIRLNLTTRSHYDQDVNDRAVNVYEDITTRTTIPHGKCVKRPPSTIIPGIPVDSP